MVTVKLKGVNPVRDQRTGEMRYYAWRGKGAPRLEGKPGSPEFIASFNAALESQRPLDNGSIASLVIQYRSGDGYSKLADSTRGVRAPYGSAICAAWRGLTSATSKSKSERARAGAR